MSNASWVIVNRLTGRAVAETFNRATVAALNTEKYKAVPILEWLASLNAKSKTATSTSEAA